MMIHCRNPIEFHSAIMDVVLEQLGKLSGQRKLSIALSGGETPVSFYSFLGNTTKVDLGEIDFFWSDERHVHKDSVRNNYSSFLKHISDPAKIKKSHPIDTTLSHIECAKSYHGIIKAYLNDYRLSGLDLCFLGFGLDGHVASLFKREDFQNEGNDLVVATNHKKNDPRISFSMNLINSSGKRIILAKGKEKLGFINMYLNGSLPDECPLAHIKMRNTHFIYCDS